MYLVSTYVLEVIFYLNKNLECTERSFEMEQEEGQDHHEEEG